MHFSIDKFGAQKYIPFKLKPHKKPLVPWKDGDLPIVTTASDFNVLYNYLPVEAIGFECGENFVVIDVDNKNGKVGSSLLKIWEEDYDLDLSDCYFEKTPSGGFHYYIENDSGEPIPSNKKYSAQGIDILGQKSLCILYGTKGQPDSGFTKLSELPKKFIHGVINSKTQKAASKLRSDTIDFDEAVNLLSYFPANYWDDKNRWHKYTSLIRDTLSFENGIKLTDRFMNESEREARTGGKTQVTNEKALLRNPSNTGFKFSWGGVRNEATEFGYEDPEVELELGFLKEKKDIEPKSNNLLKLKKEPLEIPHGLAGEIVKNLIENKGLNLEAAIILGSQTLSAYFFASDAYYEGENLSQRVLQLGDSNSGKSYNVTTLDKTIRQLASLSKEYRGFINDMPVSDGALLDDLGAYRVLNISSDEAKSFFTCDTDYSPLATYLSIATTGKGGLVIGKSRRTSQNSDPVSEPIVNLIMNDTFINFDKYRDNAFFEGGGVRRFDIVYVKSPKRTLDVYKKMHQSKRNTPLNPNVVVKLKDTIKSFRNGRKKYTGDNSLIGFDRSYVDLITPNENLDFLFETKIKFDSHPDRTQHNEHIFSFYRDKIEIFASRLALLNRSPERGLLELTKYEIEWAGKACLYFCLRCIELYENSTDKINEALQKAKNKITDTPVGFVSFTRQFFQNKPQLLSLFQQVIREDTHFEIIKVRNGLKIKRR